MDTGAVKSSGTLPNLNEQTPKKQVLFSANKFEKIFGNAICDPLSFQAYKKLKLLLQLLKKKTNLPI
jgi:hypothetical protein